MKGRFASFLILFFVMMTAFVTVSHASPPDSLRTKWVDGKKYILHKVLAKETWTSVAKKYNITVEQLQQANHGVSVLKISQIIQVPSTGTSFTQPIKEKESSPTASTPVKEQRSTANKTVKYHTVEKGETLYRISKDGGITVDELKALNNLTSNNVSVGQKLIIGTGKAIAVAETQPVVQEIKPVAAETKEHKSETVVKEPVVKETVTKEPVKEEKREVVESAPVKTEIIKTEKPDVSPVNGNDVNSRSSVTEKDPKNGNAYDKIVETGMATWITDGELNQNKFYALHRSAPVGTIIKVSNRMNNNSVFVKVVGLLPDTGDNANVIIKITQAAAQRIGAIDQRFQAELSYGMSK